jgi:hypothetical protein
MKTSREYGAEDVLKHAREAFAQTIRLKVEQLYRYVPRGSNTELTGDFVEELVRGFIQKWLGHRRLLSGTFYSTEFEESHATPLQVDGIVHDPQIGPVILEEGGFVVVHPAFCTSVIEIKTSVNSVPDFQTRLRQIYDTYMHHRTTCHVMGVVIADADAVTKSRVSQGGREFLAYEYYRGGWCPVFILFSENDGKYEPHFKAIDAMIRGIHRNQLPGINYMS